MERRKRNSKKAKSFASVFSYKFWPNIRHTALLVKVTQQPKIQLFVAKRWCEAKNGGTLKSNLGIHASTNSKEVFRSFPRPILAMEHYTKIQASTPRDLLRKQSRFYKQYNWSIFEKKSIRYHKIPPRAITCWDCLNTVSTAYTACTAFTAFTADQGGRSCAFQKGLRWKV